MRLRFPLHVLPVAAALLLQACATTKSVDLPPLTDWETRQDILGGFERWKFKGRIGVSSGDEGFNGKLRWSQDRNTFSATVSGPIGAGSVRIAGNGEQVTLTEKDGEITNLDDPENDLQRRYGWTIPIASLRYWALGIPDPASEATTSFDDSGLLVALTQGGWQVSIGQYREGAGQLMPRRITATHATEKVRLVIDSWSFF